MAPVSSLNDPATRGDEIDTGSRSDGVDGGDRWWLRAISDAWRVSSDFQKDVLTDQWERNYANFHSEHPPGSKYLSDEYRGLSSRFRPKTRATLRKDEAAAAAALFSTEDVVSVQANDDNDPAQLASSRLWQEVLNYRLSKTIPWFMIAIGARQDANVLGVCCSKQYWEYEEREGEDELQVAVDPETGQEVLIEAPSVEVLKDRPVIKLIPPENLHIHPSADWLDPVNSSPYLIHLVPMTVAAVKARMKEPDAKTGAPQWRKYEDGVISQALKPGGFADDSTALARDNNRGTRDLGAHEVRSHDIVWVQENFIERNGVDHVFWSLGCSRLLTDPVPTEEVYPIGRPFVLGYGTLESHRVYPSSKVELTEDLQSLANDHENLRIDNIRLALTPHLMYEVGAVTSEQLADLRNRRPGGMTGVTSIGALQWDRPPEVTGSAYREEDRINADFDDLAGAFSSGSVQTNRAMNETVGGMQLLTGAANSLTEYDLRVWVETWVEPVLRQLLKLEQRYETDTVVLTLAGARAQLVERFGIDELTDDLLEQELSLTVNVGIGSTDPMQQLQKFAGAVEMLVRLGGPEVAARLDMEAVSAEIFGKAGYKDGARFLRPLPGTEEGGEVDPQVMEMQAALEQAQAQMQAMAAELESRQAEMELKRAEIETRERIAMLNADVARERARLDAQAEMERARMQAQTDLERSQMQAQADLAGRSMDADAKLTRDREAFTRDALRDLASTASEEDVVEGEVENDDADPNIA